MKALQLKKAIEMEGLRTWRNAQRIIGYFNNTASRCTYLARAVNIGGALA